MSTDDKIASTVFMVFTILALVWMIYNNEEPPHSLGALYENQSGKAMQFDWAGITAEFPRGWPVFEDADELGISSRGSLSGSKSDWARITVEVEYLDPGTSFDMVEREIARFAESLYTANPGAADFMSMLEESVIYADTQMTTYKGLPARSIHLLEVPIGADDTLASISYWIIVDTVSYDFTLTAPINIMDRAVGHFGRFMKSVKFSVK